MNKKTKKISNRVKIAVSSMNKNIESDVSDVFGRSSYFVIAEIKMKK